jgi:putative hydrolase of the HAD superfamily
MKTIIFDLGETLMYFRDIKKCGDLNNPDNPCINSIGEYLKSRQILISTGVIRKKLAELREKRYGTNIELGPEELVNYLAQEFKINRDKLEPLVDIFSAAFFSSAYLDPYAKEVLTKLKEKYRLGIISNSPFGIPAKYSRQALKEHGIYDIFDFTVFSSEEGIRKPDGKIFEIAFARYGLSKKETIYIGNHPVNDIEAARNFGIDNIILTKQKDADGKQGVPLEEIPQYLHKTFEANKDES